MSSFFKDLWIFSKDGIPLIEIFHKTEVDSSLLGALFSAIETFTKQLTGAGLKSFVFGDNKIVVRSCLEGNIYLISRSNAKVKDKKIIKIFEIITNLFEETYTVKDIENWDGDLSIFDKFKDKIDLYFKMAEL